MRLLVAGSGAVGISTAYFLSSRRHIVMLLSSTELRSPYPSEGLPASVKSMVNEIPIASIDRNTDLADAIFCCGSIKMLLRFTSSSQTPLTKPIFFLTSWGESLGNLKNKLKSIEAYIIPCYPIFACELIDGELVQVGHYQLEVAKDWLSSDQLVEVHRLLSSLSIRHQLKVMESRFLAHFSRTQFAYWFLSESRLHCDDSDDARRLLESKWKVLEARCREHPDLCISLQLMLSSLSMMLNDDNRHPSLNKIASALVNHKIYKMNPFLDRQAY